MNLSRKLNTENIDNDYFIDKNDKRYNVLDED
jgi:hypothetical protein